MQANRGGEVPDAPARTLVERLERIGQLAETVGKAGADALIERLAPRAAGGEARQCACVRGHVNVAPALRPWRALPSLAAAAGWRRS